MTVPLDPSHLDRDWQIRLAAFSALRTIADRTGGVVTREEMQAGFPFDGKRIAFADRGAGIWRPAQLSEGIGAALSIIKTDNSPYEDRTTEQGWLEYSYQKGPADNRYNLAIRSAFENRRPLIYFSELEKGVFLAAFPVFIQANNPQLRTITVAMDTPGLGLQSLRDGGSPDVLKEYATRVVRARLHQEKFRFAVLGAYARKCSVCSLGSKDRLVRLLDAAHIVPDSDSRGLPEVPNGLSLCKIHHSAYDLNILGIDPDYLIHVREDVLAEVDGPMLLHGIQEMAGEELHLPARIANRPNREYLAERFKGFRAA